MISTQNSRESIPVGEGERVSLVPCPFQEDGYTLPLDTAPPGYPTPLNTPHPEGTWHQWPRRELGPEIPDPPPEPPENITFPRLLLRAVKLLSHHIRHSSTWFLTKIKPRSWPSCVHFLLYLVTHRNTPRQIFGHFLLGRVKVMCLTGTHLLCFDLQTALCCTGGHLNYRYSKKSTKDNL